jgi:hypothetical protein
MFANASLAWLGRGREGGKRLDILGGELGKKQIPGKKLVGMAENTLGFFHEVADKARSLLDESRGYGPDAFAAVNTLTARKAVETLSGITEETRRELRQITIEPAIARIVVLDEDGNESVYFISRAGTVSGVRGYGLMASYRSPMGRLAALPVGGERDIRTPKGLRTFELKEHAALRPAESGRLWDSHNTVLRVEGRGPRTIVSLRGLVRGAAPVDEIDLLDAILAEDAAAANVVEGLQRSAIMKMGLRDQPLLDQFQDDIFRLPLNTRLVILGPPGTGKTTTLIKRLGLKLDQTYLEPEERTIVQASAAGAADHSQSWLMFTPTELLKQYVKEAFNREGIAASDLRIQTWDDFRRDLARNQLGILRTTSGTGPFVIKDGLNSLMPGTFARQTDWFDDFEAWQVDAFWTELQTRAKVLAENPEAAIARLGHRLTELVSGATRAGAAARFNEIAETTGDIQALVDRLQSETDQQLRGAFSSRLRENQALLQDLVAFLATLDPSLDDVDDSDAEADDEEEVPLLASRQDRELAFDAYMKAMRAHARAVAGRRALPRQSRNGRIVAFLGGRMLGSDQLRELGSSLLVQTALRRFLNPMRRYVMATPGRYRRYRRERQSEGEWYAKDGFAARDLAPLEVDLVLLSMLRRARDLLSDRRIASGLTEPRHAFLGNVRNLFRNQVAVDEATDFSPLQLACMASLCDPAANSFLACGDFNQRITEWGSRTDEELRWVFPDIDIRSINVSYRHSRQLNELARAIAIAGGAEAPDVRLPEHVNNDGVPAVLATAMNTREKLVAWLAMRIAEIERFTGAMPSIAVLVNSEDEVIPLAEALDVALADGNVRCVACSRGRSVGQDNDVRVFAVEHIKGLEFEAVFFVGVDELATRLPELFDKYLYVGATRAAYFLGLTTAEKALPAKIATLEARFGQRWP